VRKKMSIIVILLLSVSNVFFTLHTNLFMNICMLMNNKLHIILFLQK